MELTPEQVAAHDDQRELGPEGAAALAAAYREAFGPVTTVLDVGGGSGTALPALQQTAEHVVLVDWSRTMLAVARAAGARSLVAADVRRLPLADDVVDGVHAAYALQNVADWRGAVAECVRVCRPGAAVVVAWGGSARDGRLVGLERAYLEAVGAAAGVHGERHGLTVEAASGLFADLGRPLRATLLVEGTQRRSPRQVVERLALNPYRSQPEEGQRAAATASALGWARRELGDPDEPLGLAVTRELHVYGPPARPVPQTASS